MMGFGLYGGSAGFMLMHLFCFVLFVAVVLFFIWANKALDKKQLKKLVAGLLIVGIVGMFLAFLAGGGRNFGGCDGDDCPMFKNIKEYNGLSALEE